VATEVKFCTAEQTQVPVGPAFWPVSKFNTGSLPLRGILPVISKAIPITMDLVILIPIIA